jgi:hypothetical protein
MQRAALDFRINLFQLQEGDNARELVQVALQMLRITMWSMRSHDNAPYKAMRVALSVCEDCEKRCYVWSIMDTAKVDAGIGAILEVLPRLHRDDVARATRKVLLRG